jgi:hypothetical protein
MSDHEAIDRRLRRHLVDALGNLEQDVEGYILRADVRDLLTLDRGDLVDAGNGGEHRIDGHCAGGIARLSAGRRGAGNRATGREDHDVGLLLLLLRLLLLRDRNLRAQQRQRCEECKRQTAKCEHGGSP